MTTTELHSLRGDLADRIMDALDRGFAISVYGPSTTANKVHNAAELGARRAHVTITIDRRTGSGHSRSRWIITQTASTED